MIPTFGCTFLVTQFIRVPCRREHVEAIGYRHLEAGWAAYPVEELSHNLFCFRLALLKIYMIIFLGCLVCFVPLLFRSFE